MLNICITSVLFSVSLSLWRYHLINSLSVKRLECSLPPLIIGRHSFGRSDFSVTLFPIRSPCLSVYVLNNSKWDWPLTSALMRFNPVTALWHLRNVIVWYGNQALLVSPVNEVLWNSGDWTHPPNLINTLWAENESVIWPTFSTQSLTDCNSVLLPVKHQFMSGEGKRASEKQTIKRRKEMEQWDSLLCTAVCEGREGCCVPVGSVGSERWPADTSSSQNSIVHMFSSLTHSPHTDHDLTPTAVSSGAIYLCC